MFLKLPFINILCCLTSIRSLQDGGSRVSLLHPSACTRIQNGTLSYSKHRVHETSHIGIPIVETKYLVRKERGNYFNPKTDTILLQVVSNPGKTFSVLEPQRPGGCKNGSGILSTVRESAKQKKCILATSGGFFNLHTGECYGNIFSDGNLVQNARGIQSVHFGLTKDGYIFVGYLSESDILRHKFKELIGGLLWIIRDGKSYVEESIQRECAYIAETGDLREYPKVKSARLIIGHDKFGKMLIFQNNGKTKYFGLDIYETVPILLDLGFVNAINLDSGSSTTVVINNTVVNHPTYPCNFTRQLDRKVSSVPSHDSIPNLTSVEIKIHVYFYKDNKFSCERAVSTILCVTDPDDRVSEHSVLRGQTHVQPRCPEQRKTITSKIQSSGQFIPDCFCERGSDTIHAASRFSDPWMKAVFLCFALCYATSTNEYYLFQQVDHNNPRYVNEIGRFFSYLPYGAIPALTIFWCVRSRRSNGPLQPDSDLRPATDQWINYELKQRKMERSVCGNLKAVFKR